LGISNAIRRALDEIMSRELPDGGFRYSDTGPLSPEASAWAVLAIKASGGHLDFADRACKKLATLQQPDGRVTAVPGCKEAIWPTPLCILAWKCLESYRQPVEAGIQFLLTSKGRHFPRTPDAAAGHDTSIVGWPWIENTHSWIEPTSLSMMALRANGYKDHPRTLEAARMIMDRQLPGGGWNYGNTTVFGKELLPIPENTGQALCVLSGMTDRDSVETSLGYLAGCSRKIRTPLALAWVLQGLAVWSQPLPDSESAIEESLALQERYGPYDTALLALLVSVYFAKGKIIEMLV
jgi:hypothetical protein